MITWWELLLLSVVQGVAEFLPISSSGHLVVFESWLGISSDVSDLNIVLHAGTLVAILVVYRRRIFEILTKDRRLLGLVIVGTVPAVIVGLGVKLFLETWLESPLIAGFCLPLTGLMLFCVRTDTIREKFYVVNFPGKPHWELVVLRLWPCFPGSLVAGATIAAGLGAGLNRAEGGCGTLFLLAIPALSGAAVLELVFCDRWGAVANTHYHAGDGCPCCCCCRIPVALWIAQNSQTGEITTFWRLVSAVRCCDFDLAISVAGSWDLEIPFRKNLQKSDFSIKHANLSLMRRG